MKSFFIFFNYNLSRILYCLYIAMLSNNNLPKICHKYFCETCHYKTNKKSSYNEHLLSLKHSKSITINETKQKICSSYVCLLCSKEYKDNSGLWRHKKKCIASPNFGINDEHNDESKYIPSINDLNSHDKQQQLIEYKQMMVEQNNKMFELAKNSGNNNTNNSNNNNFNINFFLNETCKNAMNIMDFVGQLQVGIKELEDTGRLGFAEGISKIIINGLKQMDISDRPIHCSDSKREVVYIKDKDQWNKETDDKPLLTNAIKYIAHKNIKQISAWAKEHPEYNDSSSKQNDKYLRIVSNSMNGIDEEESNKNYNKIIRNIVKETVIDK